MARGWQSATRRSTPQASSVLKAPCSNCRTPTLLNDRAETTGQKQHAANAQSAKISVIKVLAYGGLHVLSPQRSFEAGRHKPLCLQDRLPAGVGVGSMPAVRLTTTFCTCNPCLPCCKNNKQDDTRNSAGLCPADLGTATRQLPLSLST